MWILDFEIENLVDILGGHGIGINIHDCKPNLEMAIYVLKKGQTKYVNNRI